MSQRDRLHELLSVNEALHIVYVLKDQLKHLFRYRRPGWARRALQQWCGLAPWQRCGTP